ncbi:MAG: NAD(P)-dependent oxidoreductase [Vicinamibacterales bacterium]
MQKVAFLGLGVMGRGMAARLVQAGFSVTVWNRSAGPAAQLQELGARTAASPAQAVSGADVIVAMVADDKASRDVWTGDTGALAGAARGSIAIECSTLSPVWVTDLADLCAKQGVTFIDSPVAGSKVQAAGGEVVFFVGGDREVLERARPVLRAMSRDIVHLGPVASGARMKLVNNFMGAVQATAVAEALAFIEACGLDPAAAMNVLYNGAPGSPLVKTLGARMMARDYAVNFLLSLMRKDIGYAIDEARRHGVELRTATIAGELFDRAIAEGLDTSDFAAIAEVVPGRRRL